MAIIDKVEEFLRNHIGEETREGPCTHLELCHLALGGKSSGARVRSWDLTRECNVRSLAADIDNEALRDAAGPGAVQTYALYIFREKRKSHAARTTFRISGDDGEGAHSSEPPSEAGLLKQLMRHNEALTKMLVTSGVQNNHSLQQALDKAMDQQSKMFTDRMEMVETMESLLQMRHERDQDIADRELKRETIEKSIGVVKALAPHVVARIGKTDGASEESLKLMLRDFVDSLTDEEMGDLQKRLLGAKIAPEKATALMGLLSAANSD